MITYLISMAVSVSFHLNSNLSSGGPSTQLSLSSSAIHQ